MSCSINRFKIQGTERPSDPWLVKDMDNRMKQMMAVRTAQDSGNFKARYEHPDVSHYNQGIHSIYGISSFPTSNPKS
jgi:hypothetical protein